MKFMAQTQLKAADCHVYYIKTGNKKGVAGNSNAFYRTIMVD